MNADVWNSMDAQTQELFATVADEMTAEHLVRQGEKKDQHIQTLKDNGYTFVDLPEADVQEWIDALVAADLPQMWINDRVTAGWSEEEAKGFVQTWIETYESIVGKLPYGTEQYY